MATTLKSEVPLPSFLSQVINKTKSMNHGESKEIKRNMRIMLWNIEGLKNATSTIAADFLEGYDAAIFTKT